MTVNMTFDFEFPALEDDSRRSRQATIASRVFETLRQAIVQLQLRPGHPLSEAEIARQLRVSRQPVREAFIKLAEIGFIEIRPQRGTYVRLISIREVRNARFIREAVEVAIVREAAANAPDTDIEALERLIADQKSVARAGDHPAFLRLDEAFHQAIARCADCDDAWRVIESLKAQMDRVRYLSLPEATPLETIIKQHEDILEGIKNGSPEAAEASMRQHLSEILISLPRLAAEHSSLFD
ncbi:GntR family transcriptional regulator [Phyllobacterium phragmitis]|uniref:GntR family transcriptional regulator n=2 Tax=Phyllobacterium phragmitis TaxID=2670329 RepID=A0ABQ0GZS3_9HYPH